MSGIIQNPRISLFLVGLLAFFSWFTRFTDDSVLTLAVADAVMNKNHYNNSILNSYYSKKNYATYIRKYALKYPDSGFGGRFEDWMKSSSPKPYRSYGNGSAMRVSAIGFAFDSLEEVLQEAKWSAMITHNHREGVKGAKAVAGAVFLARTGKSKEEIKKFVSSTFKYNLDRTLDCIRPSYAFDSSCQRSVPEAIIAFLESENFIDAIKKAISLGGDSDTIACIAGAIAHAYYREIPDDIVGTVKLKLDSSLRQTLNLFINRFNIEY